MPEILQKRFKFGRKPRESETSAHRRQLSQLCHEINSKQRYRELDCEDQFYIDQKNEYSDQAIEYSQNKKTPNLFYRVIKQKGQLERTVQEKQRFDRCIRRAERSFTKGLPLRRHHLLKDDTIQQVQGKK